MIVDLFCQILVESSPECWEKRNVLRRDADVAMCPTSARQEANDGLNESVVLSSADLKRCDAMSKWLEIFVEGPAKRVFEG